MVRGIFLIYLKRGTNALEPCMNLNTRSLDEVEISSNTFYSLDIDGI